MFGKLTWCFNVEWSMNSVVNFSPKLYMDGWQGPKDNIHTVAGCMYIFGPEKTTFYVLGKKKIQYVHLLTIVCGNQYNFLIIFLKFFLNFFPYNKWQEPSQGATNYMWQWLVIKWYPTYMKKISNTSVFVCIWFVKFLFSLKTYVLEWLGK